MGNNTSKTEKAAGCGCLIGILLGVVYAVMTMFSVRLSPRLDNFY